MQQNINDGERRNHGILCGIDQCVTEAHTDERQGPERLVLFVFVHGKPFFARNRAFQYTTEKQRCKEKIRFCAAALLSMCTIDSFSGVCWDVKKRHSRWNDVF